MAKLPSKLDARFRRFRRKGDLAALGDVFDRAAPEMLRLARRFARGDEALAEDAVQSAFLVAMERAEAFDDDRPVMPWLLGILALELRKERSSAARLPDPGLLMESERTPETPEDQAAERELKELVAARIEELPETYREAVREHLFSRSDAASTAERLGVTKGALHVRVHRGLGLLRGMLPAGAALAAGLSVAAPRGLAGMRSTVLGADGSAAVPLAASAGLTAKGALIAASLGGVVLGGGSVALWKAESSTVSPEAGLTVASRDPAVAADRPSTPLAARPRAAAREEVADSQEDRPDTPPTRPSVDLRLTVDDWVRLYGEASGYTEYFVLGKRLAGLPGSAGLEMARAVYPRLEVHARQQFGKPFVFREGASFGLQVADLLVRDRDPEVSSYGFDLVRSLALRDFEGDLDAYDSWRAETAGMNRREVLQRSAEWLELRLAGSDPERAAALLQGGAVPALQTLSALGVEPRSLLPGPGTASALEMLISHGGTGAVHALEWLHLTPLDPAGYGALVVPHLDAASADVRHAAAMALCMSGHSFLAEELTCRYAKERGIEATDPRAADLFGWGLWLHDRR